MHPKYTHQSQDEMELDFIKAHRGHNVPRPSDSWMRCRSCGAVLKFCERDALEVYREHFR